MTCPFPERTLAKMPRCCIAWLLTALAACGGADSGGATTDPGRPGDCPATAPAPSPLPGVRSEHRSLDYWLQQQSRYGDVDEVLLTPDEVADHNHAFQIGAPRSSSQAEAHHSPTSHTEVPVSITNLNAPVDRSRVEREVRDRLEAMRERITSGQYLDSEGQPLSEREVEAFALPNPTPPLRPALHRASDAIRLRCGPRQDGLFTESLDPDFDRNNCSMVRSGEPIQTLATWRGMLLARTPYALGWIRSDAPLAPLGRYEPPPQKPLTRRAILEAAFSLLDEPYGWGGHEGGRDCSRFLMDVFASVGLLLPRHSGRQALAGTFSVDVSSVESDRDRVQLLESAARRGLVVMHFPGHVMLYLGQDATGVPMAIHSFSEYLEPCSGGALENGDPAEILRRVDRGTRQQPGAWAWHESPLLPRAHHATDGPWRSTRRRTAWGRAKSPTRADRPAERRRVPGLARRRALSVTRHAESPYSPPDHRHLEQRSGTCRARAL